MEKFSKYLLVLPAFLLLIAGCPLDSSIPNAPSVPPKEDPGNYSTILWEQDSNGDIQFSTNNPGHKGYAFWAWLTAANQTAFSKVEAEVTRKSGSINGAQGVVFCLQDESNFYAVLTTANSDYAVFVCDNGNLINRYGWKKSNDLNPGLNSKNTIRVLKGWKEGVFTIYFNNKEQAYSLTDGLFNSGYCGFLAGISTDEQFPQTPADVRFRLVYPFLHYVSNPQPADASAISSMKPLLSWDATSDCQSFHLQLSTDSSFQNTNIVDDASVTAKNYQIPSALEYEKKHYWRVKPRDGGGAWHDWSPVWSFKVTRKILTYDVSGNSGVGPALAADGSLYVIHDHALCACDADGALKWTWTGFSAPAFSSPVVAPDGSIYLVGRDFGDARLFKISRTGTTVWSRSLITDNYTDSCYQPAVDSGGTVYVIHLGKLTAFKANGDVAWDFPAPNGVRYYRHVAISRDGHVYFMDGTKLYCFDKNGGKQWEYAYSTLVPSPMAIDSRDNIIFTDLNARRVISMNSGGTANWTLTLDKAPHGSPLIGANDTIYTSTHEAYPCVYAISSTGTLLWEYDPSADGVSIPAIGADGTVFAYFGGPAVLHAINQDGTLKWTYESTVYSYSPPLHSPLILIDGTLIYSLYGETAAIITECGGLADTAWPRFQQNNQNTGMKSGVAVGAALKSQSVLKATLNRGNAVKAGPKYRQKNQKADICPK